MKNIIISLLMLLLLTACNQGSTNQQQSEPVQEETENAGNEQGSEVEEQESEPDTTAETDTTELIEENNEEPVEEIAEGQKEKYLKKLEKLDLELDILVNEAVTQIELQEAQDTAFTNWDLVLNEIYDILESQLSESEMNQLRNEQREWLEFRDETAREAASKYEGGTMETLEYVSTRARLTKERSYELVDAYMK